MDAVVEWSWLAPDTEHQQGAPPESTADVDSNGAIISGTAPDNSKAVTVLLFTEGKALVNLEFNSPPNDPIAPDAAIDIGRKQDAAIKNGLPS